MSQTTNISIVRTIGKGERLVETATLAIVATLPADFDADKRGAVAEAVHAWACGNGPRPAVKTGRKGEQVTTDYGRGHDTLVKSVKRALKESGAIATPDNMLTDKGVKYLAEALKSGEVDAVLAYLAEEVARRTA